MPKFLEGIEQVGINRNNIVKNNQVKHHANWF